MESWKKVEEILTKERLYFETGIQFQKFNTIFQLYALKKQNPELLNKAKSFLMIPRLSSLFIDRCESK